MANRDPAEKNLLALLEEADRSLKKHPLSAEADERLHRLVAGEPRQAPARWSRTSRVLIPLSMAAAAAVLLWALVIRSPGSGPAPGPVAPGFSVVAGNPLPGSDRTVECREAGCELVARDLGTRLALSPGTRVRRENSAITLVQGQARVQVTPRPSGAAPVVIQVSHGRIEVLGTRFTLWQKEGSGRVELQEGSIRFSDSTGAPVTLRPGQRLEWPRIVVDAARPDAGPAPAPRTPDAAPNRTRPRKLNPVRTAELVEEIERLRQGGRYGKAAAVLRKNLDRVVDPRIKESLSYELGVLFGDHLGQRKKACRHFERHLRTHGGRRYGSQIQRKMSRLGCGPAVR